MQDRAANALLAATALLLSLAVGEVVTRAFVRMPLKRPLPEVKYDPHPVRRFTLRPRQRALSYGAPATIDDRGFRLNRSAPRLEAPNGTILALGDSSTFGLGVGDEETWPARLEAALYDSTGAAVPVENAGTISYGVFQEMSLLQERGLTSRPRIVIHGLYWNDFMNAGPPPPGSAAVVDAAGYLSWDHLSDSGSPARLLASRAVSSSALMFSLRQAAGAVRGGGNASAYGEAYRRFISSGLDEKDWKPIEGFYRNLQRLGDRRGFVPVVVILPVVDLVGRRSSADHPYPAGARTLLERLHIRFIDTFGLMSSPADRTTYFLPQGPDAHLNAAGYRLVAHAIARMLLDEPELVRTVAASPD